MNSTINRSAEPGSREAHAELLNNGLPGNPAKTHASRVADESDNLPCWEITKSVFFEAAHRIAIKKTFQSQDDTRIGGDSALTVGAPAKDRKKLYGQIHGHSFRLEISLRAQLQPGQAWVEDFDAVSRALEMVRAELDHTLLNDIPGLEIPTLEHICRYVSERLRPQFPNLARIVVERPSLGEKCEMRLNG